MKTKAYVRFLNRIEHYAADVELVDVFALSADKLTASSGGRMFDAVHPDKHPTLAKRGNGAGSRKIALGHLKASIATAHVKDLYEDVTMYLQELLAAAMRRGLDPQRLIGEHEFPTNANRLLRLGSWPAVVQFVADSVFRKLEDERSTKNLLRKMDSKLGLGIDQAVIDAALPYLEARHFLVHDDGVVDAEFAAQHASLGLKAGDCIPTDYAFVVAARAAMANLVKEIDAKVIAKQVVAAEDTQP